jgi:cytochrome c-type biogenesis protein CcsB|tara:strand:+ start:2163 stop:3089 length:927 start_codon:yes stop_codon:yes gene_type:complete
MTDFAALSLLGVYSAMLVYTGSFLFFTFDLAKRSASAPALVSAGGEMIEPESDRALPRAGRTGYQRIAVTLLVLGFVFHLLATLGRGIAAGRVPWANMFEFGLTASALIVAVFLGSLLWRDLAYLGAFVSGFVLLALGIVTVNFYVDVVPLPPALQSGWLVIHVFVASLATAFFALGAGLSIFQLIRARFEARGMAKAKLLKTLPDSGALESLAYRLNVIGFVLWSFTLIAGAIWAERAWGRYWGWDTKEVWTFIIWVLFAGYIHARATRGWRGSRSAILAIVGFGAVLFNYTVVNIAFTGLHSYSGL